MFEQEKIDRFEALAILLKDRGFEKGDSQLYRSDYEIRGLEIFEIANRRLLGYGDKKGLFCVYDRNTTGLIFKEEFEKTIDFITFKKLPGPQGLLFIGIRFKGMYVYRFEIAGGQIAYKNLGPIFNEPKFISFFYPNIVFDEKDNAVKGEIWVCFEDGDFRVYTCDPDYTEWNCGRQLRLPYVIKNYAIDRNVPSPPGYVNLFLGNTAGEIFLIPFPQFQGVDFPGTPENLEQRKILTIHGAAIEGMIPLSDYREQSAGGGPDRVFYPKYSGCLVQTGNKIICVYFDIRKNPRDEGVVHSLTKAFPNQLLDIECVPCEKYCYTAVSDVEREVHLIKNVTDMVPSGRDIEVIFDGELFTILFDDRVIKMRFTSHHDGETDKIQNEAYLGMGNHCVLPLTVYNYELKIDEAADVFYDLIGISSANPVQFTQDLKERILTSTETILDRFRFGSSKTAVKLLLLQLMANIAEAICKNKESFLEDAKGQLSRIFYKIIENEERELIIKTSEFLTRIEKYCNLSPGVVTELQVHFKKFILDARSCSRKSEKLKELAEYNEAAGNIVDAVVFKGILCDREYDCVSRFNFSEIDGEITRFVPLKDDQYRFMVCTSKGHLFLVDFKTQIKNLVFQYRKCEQEKEVPERINYIYAGKSRLYLLVRSNEIIWLPMENLIKYPGLRNDSDKEVHLPSAKLPFPKEYENDYGTSVCQMPQHLSQEDECLIGTNRGGIFHLLPGGEIHKLYRDPSNSSMILDLRAFKYNNRFLVAAGYWDGSVQVFEYFSGENPNHLELLLNIPVDIHAVNRLFVFSSGESYDHFPLIVAGTDSGRCFGIRLYCSTKEKFAIDYIFEWCYHTKESIRGIHPFSLFNNNYILISAMDSNLHILERNGISIDTIHFQSNVFQVFIPHFDIKENQWFADGYISTSDNAFQKIRLLVKSEILKKINRFFSSGQNQAGHLSVTESEILLHKFKSIAIEEKHFKMRYYLKSQEFDSAARVLKEIQITLERDHEDEIYILIALLNRLFSDFFAEILGDEEKYEKTKLLFFQTCDHWGYEHSQTNIQAQLYWIRSLLKGCSKSESPVERLNHWFLVSEKVARLYGMKEAGSSHILQHFIMHPFPFVRVKTLQYLYRFITAPESKRQEKENWAAPLVNALTDAVIRILKMYRQKNPERPEWFELEAARLMAWIVVNLKYTGFCPSRLCYILWKNDIPSNFFFRMADAILIYPGKIPCKGTFESVFRAAGTLIDELKRDKPRFSELFPRLTVFSPRCMENERYCGDELAQEFFRFFDGVQNLLDFQNIGNFSNTAKLEGIRRNRNQHFFKSQPIFDKFYDLSQEIKKYHQEKHSDVYANIMESLNFSTFYDIKKTVKTIAGLIENNKDIIIWVERELLSFVLKQWNTMIKEEIDNNVILDFANAIREYNRQCIEENRAIDMPLIFKNIFTRLNIIADCDQSYLFYLTPGSKKITVYRKDIESDAIIEEMNLKRTNIPDQWLKPEIFSALEVEDVQDQFPGLGYSPMLLKAPGPEPANTVAIYLFSWEKTNPGEISRLESREILGEFITTAAHLQAALQEQKLRQEEFFRIVSHELNQIIRGSLTWISNLQTGKMEDKPETRKEYYDRFQYSLTSADHVIKSILSFRETAKYELKLCKLDVEIEKTIKLARIDYKNYGNMPLAYKKEPGDYEIITDPLLVSTAVVNLLSNARKYNPSNKPVEMRLFNQGNTVIIEVEDKGPGIPANEFDLVFKLFERGNYAKKNNIDGLGIGLAVSKNNIELLGGKISFTSRVNTGSTFRITLYRSKFMKYHMIETKVDMKSPPNFNAVKNLPLRQKIEEKLKYNPFQKKILLRGVLMEEEFEALKGCYPQGDSKAYYLKAVEKLHHDSKEELQKVSHD